MRIAACLFLVGALLVAAAPAFALDACILVKQGGKDFEGSSKKTGHLKNSTLVYQADHEVSTSVDPHSGVPQGRRTHGALHVEMAVDASAYQYYAALIDKDKSGAKKLDVTLQFYRPDQANIGLAGAGESAPYYKIELHDAIVTSVKFNMPNSRAGAVGPGGVPAHGGPETLHVSFAYHQIVWTFTQGNKTATDTWGGQ